MMFAYELQDKVKEANKTVKVYVCHPGASATSLIETSGNMVTRIMYWLMMMTPYIIAKNRSCRVC